ncbi:hypothetical protein AKJ45_03860 [candidate division MSBL1 archaeon SCGC-AAA261F19]|uniref:Uncharacterized protein n=1 Tax=candidate division MSBL1 archaeon SCGC-AAA261F19 TaxID=1698275 RepID=A0A133V636_9EURY|nr:hypothetical protein AKJ45_03860 [candidate division MSBL1 archaeon SCGC-AAA261F19]
MREKPSPPSTEGEGMINVGNYEHRDVTLKKDPTFRVNQDLYLRNKRRSASSKHNLIRVLGFVQQLDVLLLDLQQRR